MIDTPKKEQEKREAWGPDEILRYLDLDPDQWLLKSSRTAKWWVVTADGDRPVHYVRANVEPKNKIGITADEFLEELATRVGGKVGGEPPPTDFRRTPPNAGGRQRLALLAPTDVHIGSGEGDNGFLESVKELRNRAAIFGVDSAALLLGSDFLHFDNLHRTTTKGTPLQDSVAEHQEMVREGVEAAIAAVTYLLGQVPGEVRVCVVPGNHDEAGSFWLGELLRLWSLDKPRCTVDQVGPRDGGRLYFSYGVNLIGLYHGHLVARKDLPLLMAHERSDAWSACWSRMWFTGDDHVRGYIPEHAGVEVRALPALQPINKYARDRGYTQTFRGAEAHIFDEAEGYLGLVNYRCPENRPTR